jgi:hypothetical protein
MRPADGSSSKVRAGGLAMVDPELRLTAVPWCLASGMLKPGGARPAQVVQVRGCDPDLGLGGPDLLRVQAALGGDDRAPNVDIVVQFERI